MYILIINPESFPMRYESNTFAYQLFIWFYKKVFNRKGSLILENG